MAKFRNIRVRMAGGKTRTQRAMVLASGKLRFVSNRKRSSPSHTPARKTHKRSVRYMARRKRSYSRRSSFGSLGKKMVGGFGYGVVREPINQLAKKVPFVGGFGDEVLMLGVSALLATKTSGVMRQIGNAGVYVESHNLGRNIAGGMLGGILGTSATSTTSSGATF